MALETVVYPQDQFGGNIWGFDYVLQEDEDKSMCEFLENTIAQEDINGNLDIHYNSSSSSVMHTTTIQDQWDQNSPPEVCTFEKFESPFMESVTPIMTTTATTTTGCGRRKRRRTKSGKNKEELENQRMTHIAVERNRRKQMNEYLAVIRSLMPASYVQRGDQASIIGGAINFVKELEKNLQTLEAQKRTDQDQQQQTNTKSSQLFSNFFTFPQYSTQSTDTRNSSGAANEYKSASLADIEVTVVERHANLKILSKKRPRQLLKLVAGLQCLWLTILHLNVTTTVDQMVLYTLSLKLEEGCQIITVDEIADAVNGLLGRIEEEANHFS